VVGHHDIHLVVEDVEQEAIDQRQAGRAMWSAGAEAEPNYIALVTGATPGGGHDTACLIPQLDRGSSVVGDCRVGSLLYGFVQVR